MRKQSGTAFFPFVAYSLVSIYFEGHENRRRPTMTMTVVWVWTLASLWQNLIFQLQDQLISDKYAAQARAAAARLTLTSIVAITKPGKELKKENLLSKV